MIVFSCAQCAKQYRLKPEFAGRMTQCSGCKAPLRVPQATPAASDRIAFACTGCGMKFSVPPDCAGRATQCPTCKESLVVPTLDLTADLVPAAGAIHGTRSSLVQAGLEGGVTLTGDFATAEALSVQNLIDGRSSQGARYVVEGELARGGMGAVMRAVDCDIRREVAVKYLLDQRDANKKLRFVEEAQITGQLEHPNIVPIHELGVDAEQRIFFSMKMVKGRSLADILKAQEAAATDKQFSQTRLLNLFVGICNALAYAHSRGVVHRDLKPANVMVGDFGEVYVMDWGLAKVLRGGVATAGAGPVMATTVATSVLPFDFSAPAPLATPVATGSGATAASSGTGKVVTSREGNADLTQAGSVIGTPVYMPPEQASGKLDQIDERSDIYSLGAILYEIMTLQPPVSREGGYWPILMRVSEGQIEPPEKRAPARAHAGKVPPELTAIAMKALAKSKEDRYASVEALRKDIERFLEGRSVSAKQDTLRETAVKLVKRNKGVSIATGAAAAVLLIGGVWSLITILGANARTQHAFDALVEEQKAKRTLALQAVPSQLRAARFLINERQFDDALVQINAALDVESNQPEVRRMKGEVYLARLDFPAACAELERSLKLKSNQPEVRQVLELARQARADDIGALLTLADELNRGKAFAVAAQLTQQAEKLLAPRKELLEVYQRRLKSVWPKIPFNLHLWENGDLELVIDSYMGEISDLSPLAGMPINRLNLAGQTKVRDVTPLKGLPLKALYLHATGVEDLTPLAELPLVELYVSQKASRLDAVKKMPLQKLDCTSGSIADITPLRGMTSLRHLSLYGCPVADLTPLQGIPLTFLNIYRARVKDLAPLKGMPLVELNMQEGVFSADLSPLQGMPLKRLEIAGNDVPFIDLSPLKGLPLEWLALGSRATDLAPLKGMPLRHLELECLAEDLTPLQGAPLTMFRSGGTKVTDLRVFKGMPLETLLVGNCDAADLSPLAGLPLKVLDLRGFVKATDVTPLAGLKLAQLVLPPNAAQGLEVIRAMRSLETINGKPAPQFWKEWDAKAKPR